ncbi:hypothetical protein AB3X96_34870 [Paraburkholderia sp. BR13439]|uniref:hypothetical protein n=1 Tax=Paraburkholderia sp. BR13439 TaxID=3236996 RepID=UPI0034CD8B72
MSQSDETRQFLSWISADLPRILMRPTEIKFSESNVKWASERPVFAFLPMRPDPVGVPPFNRQFPFTATDAVAFPEGILGMPGEGDKRRRSHGKRADALVEVKDAGESETS